MSRKMLTLDFLSLCIVVMWFAAAAQTTTITPLSYTAFLDPSDVSVRFTCTGEGFPSWRVDGQIASNTEIWDRGITTKESNEEGGNFAAQMSIPATVENNNTEVQCLALSDTVGFSGISTFRVQGRAAL